MIPRPEVAIATVAAVLAATPAASHSLIQRQEPRTVARLHGAIWALAQSKTRIAWLRGPYDCPVAEVFEINERRRLHVTGARNCEREWQLLSTLAFDGNRLLWQHYSEGLSGSAVHFVTAAVNDRRRRAAAGAYILRESQGGTYQGPLPMSGAGGDLVYYFRCESGDNCSSPAAASDVRRFVGRSSQKLYAAARPVGLAIAGNRLAALEDELVRAYSPAWSPDGRSLAWVQTHFDGPARQFAELVSARRDGSRVRRLARGPGVDVSCPPSWAPDRTALAFCRRGSGSTVSTIATVAANGASVRLLGDGWKPTWSPDGTKIAFVRQGEVFLVNRDGSQERQLTSGSEPSAGAPQWSPDGRRLAVSRNGRINVVDAATGAATAIGPEPARDPVWSPDGRQIAFAQKTSDPFGWSIAVMSADGNAQRFLTYDTTGYQDDSDPSWSPDGSKIAFFRTDPEEGSTGLFIIAPDGRGGRRVADLTTGAAWSPDAHLLAWGEGGVHGDGLFVGNADGSGRAQVAGEDDAPVEIRDLHTGRLFKRFVAPGRAISVSMSGNYVAVVVARSHSRELLRYRRRGKFLGRSRLPNGASPYGLTVGARTIVYAGGRRIFAVDAKTGITRIVANATAPPVGLSILGRRVGWAENLGRDRSTVRAITLPE
jgi:WD40-like Beta Propeller Repeat/Dipeptidyl peptidase IV (DPP IV) N-terminal region